MVIRSPSSLGGILRLASAALLCVVAAVACSIGTDLSDLTRGSGGAGGAVASGATGASGGSGAGGVMSATASGGGVAGSGSASGTGGIVVETGGGGSGGSVASCNEQQCAASCPECQTCTCMGDRCEAMAEFHTPCSTGF